ncbi:otoancorin isoform X2 [Epinephelus lanceolatus]
MLNRHRQAGVFTMAPKGGTFFFLLIVSSAALAEPPGEMPEEKPDFKKISKKLMKTCIKKGYEAPELMELKALYRNSDLPVADRDPEESNAIIPDFLQMLQSVRPAKANKDPQVNTMPNKNLKLRSLLTMIKLMRNSPAASACYMQAFVAPLSLKILTSHCDNNMTTDDYNTLQWAAKPALKYMLFRGMNLPPNVDLNKTMEIMNEEHGAMSKQQKRKMVKWVKEQIAQKYFNCTRRLPSDSKSMPIKNCKPSLEWLNAETLSMMGPYISLLDPSDVDPAPKEQLCKYFHSGQFKSATSMTTKMNPSLGKKLLQKSQGCFREEELAMNVDKLGILVCHYSAGPNLTLDLSWKLLSELNDRKDCGNRGITGLRKRLVKIVASHTNGSEALHMLGRSIALLSPKQLSEFPDKDLKEVLKNLSSSGNLTIRWRPAQLRALAKKLMDKKFGKVSGKELMDLQPVVGGLPTFMFRHVKEILNDTEGLKRISKWMRKGQRMALLQGSFGDVDLLQLVKKLPGALLCSLSLDKLRKGNITSWDQVVNKEWKRSQAAFLVKKLYNSKKPWYKRLHSLIRGVTCKMIDEVADSDTKDMAQAITETPQWVSKLQAGCVAQKLFATLEKERADYFKTITEEEMKNIPTCLLLHLPPLKIKDLPDSVCPTFIDKIEEADLSLLPHHSPSRPALTERALLCLAKGTNLSRLTDEDVSSLKPLLCELQSSQLLKMAPDVRSSVLQDMADCQYIPQRHRAEITQLVTQTFGDPSNMSAEDLEALGPLLFLNDSATSALPNKPWMKDILCSLKSNLFHAPDALRKKCFDLITGNSDTAQKIGDAVFYFIFLCLTFSVSLSANNKKPTVELIEELQMDNVYWTAAQLEEMSAETFLAVFEVLGDVCGFNANQLAVLSKKANETLGPVSQMTESVVMQLGCIIRGFSDADLEELPIPLDSLENIAKCGWKESQMKSVWRGVAKYNNLTAQQLGAADMVELNQFMCGLDPDEISQLDMDAFREAVGSMDDVQFPPTAARRLKSLAVSAFGNPNTWPEAQVSDLGTIIAGLNGTELASLDPSVFPFLSHPCIPVIAPDNFAQLSPDQLKAFEPDAAAKVTAEQRSALGKKQLDALESAEAGSPYQTQRSDHSGAPSLSVEGISAFTTPLLFLLMGFLLL